MNTTNLDTTGVILRFGPFELDIDAEQLLKDGRTVRLQPQPFKLLRLLASTPGQVVTREQIQSVLWADDTFVDFDQGVNFAVKQVREALGEDADRPMYIQTVPRRGYKFLAAVTSVTPGATTAPAARGTELRLHKALWANIAELRQIEEQRAKRRKNLRVAAVVLAVLGVAALAVAAVFLVTAR